MQEYSEETTNEEITPDNKARSRTGKSPLKEGIAAVNNSAALKTHTSSSSDIFDDSKQYKYAGKSSPPVLSRSISVAPPASHSQNGSAISHAISSDNIPSKDDDILDQVSVTSSEMDGSTASKKAKRSLWSKIKGVTGFRKKKEEN